MGAGAGYSVRGVIDPNTIKINWFEVESPFIKTEDFGDGYTKDYQLIPIKCDIDCGAKDVESEAYYDYGVLLGLTPIKITEMTLIPYYDLEDISEVTEDVIWYALRNLKFDVTIGGGWSHTTFNGELYCEDNQLNEDPYNDFYFQSLTMHVTSKQAIEAIDEYSTGDNIVDRYSVVDIEGDFIEELFDDLDEAISFAKETNGYQVISEKMIYTYEVSIDGEVGVYDSEYIREYGSTVEWTNPNHIDEDY